MVVVGRLERGHPAGSQTRFCFYAENDKMGSWEKKAFENDSALDWLAELKAQGVPALRAILLTVAQTDEDEYLDIDDGASAIAAAEIVAAALGHGRDRVPPQVNTWLDANPGAILVEDLVLARRAAERVLAANSELRALRNDDGSSGAWHADMRVLLTRLGGNPATATPPAKATHQTTREPAMASATGQQERSKMVLLTFLRARGLEPDKQQMQLIRACRDGAAIRSWLARAINAPSVEAVLDGEEK